MVKKNKSLIFGLFAFLLTLVGGFVLSGCSRGANERIAYASSVEDFNAQFQTQKVIYVDDLDFATDTVLNINRSVKFVGKNNKSTLSRLFINISASNVYGERIKVEFENIIFDGGFDKPSDEILQTDDTFSNILGNRDNKNCINASVGHYDLNINNCEFTNYASEYGSVMYVDNYLDSPNDKVININNSKFYGNVCYRGTLDIFHDKTDVKITNCDFYENYGAFATGFNIGNGKLVVDNCVIKDNVFCKFQLNDNSRQEDGGGVSIGAFHGKISNTKIINNKSFYGGGMALVSSDSGDNSMVIENCIIKDNEAVKEGGGVIVHSKEGQPISFIGCEISFNKAPSRANVCAVPMGYWTGRNPGNVNFYFCKIAMNDGGDGNGLTTDLDYYVPFIPSADESKKVNVIIKGSIIIDDTTLTANDGDYNYIASPAQAEHDGVIDTEKSQADKTLCLLSNNKTNIVVPASVYSLWNIEFAGATKALKAGSFVRSAAKRANLALIVPLSVVAVAGLAVLTFVIIKTKKKPAVKASYVADVQAETPTVAPEEIAVSQAEPKKPKSESPPKQIFTETEIEKIVSNWDLVKTLSNKEKEVFVLRLSGKKRKDIAKHLFVSDNTIKKHMNKIYVKLGVSTGKELSQLAKEFLN